MPNTSRPRTPNEKEAAELLMQLQQLQIAAYRMDDANDPHERERHRAANAQYRDHLRYLTDLVAVGLRSGEVLF
jgi:Ser/Thr protein kinase RdoA (MazF antagonist)